MARIGTIDFSGISGHKYTFNVYPIKNDFKKNKGAVYVVTRRTVKYDGTVDHNLLFIGTCKDVSTVHDMIKDLDCFTREHANCICTYWEDNTKLRVNINDDLINHYHPPCNYE